MRSDGLGPEVGTTTAGKAATPGVFTGCLYMRRLAGAEVEGFRDSKLSDFSMSTHILGSRFFPSTFSMSDQTGLSI